MSHISEEERMRRMKVVQEATASIALEGFKITPEEIEHTQRFINGEIDLDEFLRSNLNQRYQKDAGGS